MFNNVLKVLAILSIVSLMGCEESNQASSGDIFATYAKQVLKTPNLTGEPKIDNLIKTSSKLYSDSKSLFDEYQKSVSKEQDYVEFVNKTNKMDDQDALIYYSGLSPEKQKVIQAVRNLGGVQSLSKASALLDDAKDCYGSIAELKDYVSSTMMANPLEAGKALSAIKDMAKQTKSTIETLDFLTKQYNLLNHLTK